MQSSSSPRPLIVDHDAAAHDRDIFLGTVARLRVAHTTESLESFCILAIGMLVGPHGAHERHLISDAIAAVTDGSR